MEATLQAVCLEWTLVLAVLLLDAEVVHRSVARARDEGGIDGAVLSGIIRGSEELYAWAQEEW